MGVLQGTLDRGPLKHEIGSCIWDNVKDPIYGPSEHHLFLECNRNVDQNNTKKTFLWHSEQNAVKAF